jgi:chromosomal replication initiation ATPase DnaA
MLPIPIMSTDTVASCAEDRQPGAAQTSAASKTKVLMSENNDRRELERRLEQVRRLSNLTNDALTKERLEELARDIEEQLTK